MSTLRYPQVNTLADVEKLIAGAIDSASTMKRKVQFAAVSIMILAGKEGADDEGITWQEHAIKQANYLVEQLGNGIRGDGLVKFFVYKCGFSVNQALKKEGFINVKGPDWIRDNLEEAKATMWYSFAPANPYKGFDLNEKLNQILKEARNAQKIASADEEKAKLIHADADMIDVLSSLLSGSPVKAAPALKLIERLIPEHVTVTDHNATNDQGQDVTEVEPVAVNQ